MPVSSSLHCEVERVEILMMRSKKGMIEASQLGVKRDLPVGMLAKNHVSMDEFR